jgi:hypothetical protein
MALAAAASAQAAQYVYPAQGQDAARQAADEADCSRWATQQTGFDPAKVTAPPATAGLGGSAASALGSGVNASSAPASGLGGSATSAALGALMHGGLGGLGGLGGAGAGEAVSLLESMGQHQQQQAQAPQPQPQAQRPGQADFEQARAACLTGRGYSVR